MKIANASATNADRAVAIEMQHYVSIRKIQAAGQLGACPLAQILTVTTHIVKNVPCSILYLLPGFATRIPRDD